MNILLLLLGFSLFICQIQSATVSIGRHFSSSFDNYNNNEMNSSQGNDPKNLNRNRRGVGGGALVAAGRVLISQVGQKVVSAQGDEIIDRTGILDTSTSNKHGKAMAVGAFVGAVAGGVVGSIIAPGPGTAVGAASGAVIVSGVVGVAAKIIDSI